MNENLMADLAAVFNNARSNVDFYRNLYADIPAMDSIEDFSRLPIVTKRLLTSQRLRDSLSAAETLCMTRTYEDNPAALDYFPRVLSYEDAVEEYALLDFFVGDILGNKNRENSIMLIGDPLHAYAVAEMGNQLAYYNFPLTATIVRDDNREAVAAHLAWFKPTILFLDGSDSGLGLDSVQFLVTFNRFASNDCSNNHTSSVTKLDLMRDNFVGPFAVRKDAENCYRFDPELFYLETSPVGRLLITSPASRLQPVIRFELPYYGTMLSENSFVLAPN